MCRDCHWWHQDSPDAFRDGWSQWVPCALKPDKVVVDKRVLGGFDRQAYVMSETYECKLFMKGAKP